MKQLDIAPPSGPPVSAPLVGNKEAQAAADKVRAALSGADEDARLFAERNAALDFAIEQLQEGKRWAVGALGTDHTGFHIDELLEGSAGTEAAIDAAFAELLRQDATNLCAIGALGSGEGIFSHGAIDAAVNAVSRHVEEVTGGNLEYDDGSAYGYAHGDNVFTWNDRQKVAAPVIAAFNAAKSLPLEKS